MSSYCKCGLHHEEDDSRLCAKCQAHADLVASHERLVKALELAKRQIVDLDNVLNQGNHKVIGWHMNGATEPVSEFFEQNDYGAVEAAEQALTQAREVKGRMT